MAIGPEAALGQGGPAGNPMAPTGGGGVLQGGYQYGTAPGTSGSLASIFSDAAHGYKEDRLREEEEDEERRAGRFKTLEATGKTVMRQAEMASDAKALQTAQWKDQGMVGKTTVTDKMGNTTVSDNPFQVNQPSAGDFKGKMRDLFSKDQTLGLSDKSADMLKGGDFKTYQDFVGSDKFSQSGIDPTQLGKDLGWGDTMNFDPAAGGQGPMQLPARGEIIEGFGGGYNTTPASDGLFKNVSAGVKDIANKGKNLFGGGTQAAGGGSQGGAVVAGGGAKDVAANVASTAAEATTEEATKAAAKGALGKVAGGVAGGVGAVKGGMKMAESKTARGKTGGALEMAGGAAAAGAALGLLSGPVGWAGLGASLVGGFLSD